MDTMTRTKKNLSNFFDKKESDQKIFWTDNYEIFKFLEGNRYPRTRNEFRHIREIKLSILEDGWWRTSHIIVNKNMVVMDGQYRLWALKEIEKETGKVYKISYEINDTLTLSDIPKINRLQLKWNAMDYIFSYAKSGNKNYQFIKEIWENYNLPYSAILTLIANGKGGGTNSMKKFRSGEIVVDDKNKQRTVLYISYIIQLAPYFSDYKSCRFIQALTFFLYKDNFDFNEFLKKLELRRDKLYSVSTVSEYKKLIQELYNWKRGKKITFIQA